MKIEKTTPLPNLSPAFSADELGMVDQSVSSTQIDAMIQAVTDWIESRCGVICRLTDFRITLTPKEILQRAIRLPISPVLAITSAKIDVKELPEGSVLTKNAHLVIDPKIKDMGKDVIVDLLVGFTENKVPHTVKVAAMMVCKHWLKNPSDFENRKFRDANAIQLLQMHTPCMVWPTHAMEGGSLWQ